MIPGNAVRSPDVRARALSVAYAVVPSSHRQAQGSRPAVSICLFAPAHACRCCGLPSPCHSAPGSPSLVFINRQSRPRITTRFTYDKCSAYLFIVTVRRVDNYRFSFTHRARTAASQVRALLCPWGGRHDPQPFPTAHTGYAPFYTSNPHGRAQQAGPSYVSPPRARASEVLSGQEPAGVDAGLLRRSDGGSSACSGEQQEAGISGEPPGGSGRRRQSGPP